MSDPGSESGEDFLAFDPAWGWRLRPDSLPGPDAGRSDSDPPLPPDSGLAPEDLLSPPPPGLPDLHFSIHRRPSRSAPGSARPEPWGRAPRPGASGRGAGYPTPGTELAGFLVLRELGRGAFARVYLAEQLNLAHRQVALKVSDQPVGEESQLLARLQHTHIVPIHSVHEDPASGLNLICMPYLGGANLAQVLEALSLEPKPSQALHGGSLIYALDRVSGPMPSLPASRTMQRGAPPPRGQGGGGAPDPVGGGEGPGARPPSRPSDDASSPWQSGWGHYWSRITSWSLEGEPEARAAGHSDRAQPARHFLRHATMIRASAWIAARLAEGLEHAHSRGLLHRDLKPSNILITADGTPMILDFNLSTAHDAGTEVNRARLGGTLPYMAPEHLDAFHPRGSTPARAVDERSDLYALGLILFEMVTGRHPFREPPDGLPIEEVLDQMIVERRAVVPSARAVNPAVPRSLDSLIRKCLDPRQDGRYQCAGDLAEDLRRFLDDYPLRHAPDPSIQERVGKFLRRNPRWSSATTVGAFAMVLLIILISMFVAVKTRGEAAAARLALKDFELDFNRCQVLLNPSVESSAQRGEDLNRGLVRAREVLARYEVDRLGRDWVNGPRVRSLHPTDQRALVGQMAELLMLEARATVAAARDEPESEYARALVRAIQRLDLAEQIDPRPPSILFAERASYAAALGLHEQADRDRHQAEALPPETARDYYLRGTAALADGRNDLAEPLLDRAIGLDPRRFWSWFALGLCHYDQGRYGEAAADFAVCTLLDPRSARAFANRGLALALNGRIAEARRAYDEAVILDPDLIPARVNRALVSLEMDEPAQAASDLDFALNRSEGRRDPVLLAAWGEALARSGREDEAHRRFGEALKQRPGDPVILVARGFVRLAAAPAAARDDFTQALVADPRFPRAHLGLAHVLRPDDPEAALAHLDAALDAQPDLIDAVQLRALIRARLGMRSAVADVDRLRQVPTAHRLYNAASALALLCQAAPEDSLRDEALDLLRRAIDAGFDPAFAASDPDMDSLRDLPGFARLVGVDG